MAEHPRSLPYPGWYALADSGGYVLMRALFPAFRGWQENWFKGRQSQKDGVRAMGVLSYLH